MEHLEKFNFKKDASISVDFNVKCADALFVCSKKSILSLPDPRSHKLRRVYGSAENFQNQSPLQASDLFRRIVECGVLEGPLEMQQPNRLFPYECNADVYDAVDSDKGCYLGQEMTTRIFTSKVIRKRILPFVVEAPFSVRNAIKEHTPVKIGKEEIIGNIGAVYHDNSRGIAFGSVLVRLSKLFGGEKNSEISDSYEAFFGDQSKEHPIKILIPPKYKQFIRESTF